MKQIRDYVNAGQTGYCLIMLIFYVMMIDGDAKTTQYGMVIHTQ